MDDPFATPPPGIPEDWQWSTSSPPASPGAEPPHDAPGVPPSAAWPPAGRAVPPVAHDTSPPAGYGTPPPAGYGTPPPAGYGTPPPAGYGTPPPAGYGTPPAGYGTPPAGYGTPPPAGYGTPPPAGYGAPSPAAAPGGMPVSIPGPVDPFGRDPLAGAPDYDPFGHAPARNAPPSADPDAVVWRGHPTIRGMIGWYAKGLLVSVLLGALLLVVEWLGFISLGLAVVGIILILAGYLGLGWVLRRTSSYWFTGRTVYARFGIILRQGEEAHTQAVRNVVVTQTLLERMLGVGTVNFDTAGENAMSHENRAHAGDILRFRGVDDPWTVAALFRSAAPPTAY